MIELTFINNISSIDIQLHFYFEDNNVHTMNAEIFNACQRQFINALRKADEFLDEVLSIEVTAREEGGLIDNIRIAFKHPLSLNIITALVTSFFHLNFDKNFP
jgi:hypothetical protein